MQFKLYMCWQDTVYDIQEKSRMNKQKLTLNMESNQIKLIL